MGIMTMGQITLLHPHSPHTHAVHVKSECFFYSDHDLETDTLDIVLDRR